MTIACKRQMSLEVTPAIIAFRVVLEGRSCVAKMIVREEALNIEDNIGG